MALLPGEELRLCVAVTAHRDLLDGEIGEIESRVESFFRQLAADYPGLPIELLNPLAAGGDQLVARVALRMGIPVIAVLPMAVTEYEEDFADAASLSEFRDLLQLANQVICLPAAPGNGAAPFSGRAREVQYAQLGVFLSNHCQVLLALWDGKPGEKLGGTGQVVQFHLTAVMPGFEADSSPASLLADNENDLVYHIVVSRNRCGGQPAAGLTAGEAAWFSSRNEGDRTAKLPGEYRVLLDRLQRFARDRDEKRSLIARNSHSLLRNAPALPAPSGSLLTDRFFQDADGLAIHYQRRVHRSLLAIHVLAVLMGFDFIIYAEYDGPRYMVLIFLALFFYGLARQTRG